MLGLPQGTVKLVPYTSSWQTYFKKEAERLREAIGDRIADVRHIGSTAIPGICAKPIIDIMVGLNRLEDLEDLLEPLAALGYLYKGEQTIPGWHFFVKGDAERKTHHLHVVASQSNFWTTRLLFQEYLCQHPEVAEAYESLKQQLARQYPNDRASYTQGKADFIQAVIEMALRARRHAHDDAPPVDDLPVTMD